MEKMYLQGASPVIAARELQNMAEAFGTELVTRLTDFNAKHPVPNMNSESNAPINLKDRSPEPLDFYPAFQIAFCQYVASRCIITP